jgi:hypothetical protein
MITPFIIPAIKTESFLSGNFVSTISIPQVLPDLGLYIQGQTVDDDGG